MKKNKAFGRTLLYTLLTVAVLLTGAGFYVLDYAIQPDHSGRQKASWEHLENDYPGLHAWYDSLLEAGILRDTVIRNDAGVRLHAYYAPADSAVGTAVVVHGYTDNALRMMMIGRMYRDRLHYNILLPDLQNHGQSEGASIQMGWKDRLDVMRWTEVAHELFADSTMVLHGISMGAATVMMVSGETLPDYIRAFVADCGYTSVWEQFGKELKGQFGLPAFPLLHIASGICDLRFGWNFREASAINSIARNERPTLFIHGDRDDYVPTEMVYRLYEAKRQGAKELWIAPNTDHAHAYRNHPQEYTRRVGAFLDTYATPAPLRQP